MFKAFRSDKRAVLALTPFAVLALALAFAVSAHASAGSWEHGRVGLGDATRAPTVLALLHPRQSVTYAHGRNGYNCARAYFSDVQAYSWQGFAIGAQTWDKRALAYYWRGYRGRVRFDGVSFYNGTHASVLVGGWCG